MSGLSDKVKGTVNKIKGETKDQIGNASGNKEMQADGKKDKMKGSFQNTIGEAKDMLDPDRNNR
ncbi:CsbD family protein [Bacillus sp. M6-12]|uniref:CsbD family protein n=1 Tax=Bacillus sp. M6-12 TaxID=2054166 RepID=UPI000C75602E|nr:CsbD family protein [Bacillus sp. M6-12]PLS17570.1 CsbD family protein [Bacillus sp. M6-12]